MRPGIILDGTYRLEARIGTGATGEVFRATHLALNKAVAIKVLRPHTIRAAQFFARFRQEAEALGRLSHPAIVRVTDFGIDPNGEGTPYLVMDLVDGGTLESGRGGLDDDGVDAVVAALGSALDHAHARGVTHGDLSPRNILLSPTGRPTLTDFGLARLDADAISAAPLTIVGTPGYMAPELLQGAPPTPASDIYALGALAYWMLCGRAPSAVAPDDESRAPEARLSPAPPADAELSPEIDAALAAALAADPAARPRTAGEFCRALLGARARAARRRWYQRHTPRRAALAAVIWASLTILVPWIEPLPLVDQASRVVFDAQLWLRPARTPDPRLLIVSIDDQALAADPTPLTARGAEAGERLRAMLEAGAAVVALDLLLPAAWSEAPAFGRLLLDHADRVVLAVAADGEGRLVGPEVVSPLVTGALGAERTGDLFGFVTRSTDNDGVTRRAPTVLPDTAANVRFTLPGRVAQLAGAPCPRAATLDAPCARVVVDYSARPERLERVSWHELPAIAETAPERFRNRLVIVGAEFIGSGDTHALPWSRAPVSGVTLQALVADTLLAATPVREPTGSARQATVAAGLALAAVPAALGLLLVPGARRAGAAACCGFMLCTLVAAAAARWTGSLLPWAPVASGWILAISIAGLLRARLARIPG